MLDRDVVFAVDLDGTLVKTDLLHENLFGILSSLRRVVETIPALLAGKAAFKAALSRHFDTDVARLPYRAEVLELIAAARRDGRRVVLVSAADQAIVDRIAAHLDCFDEAHGSDGSTNLAGAAKAAFLVARFGRRGFDYIGDARVDMPVWREARTALTIAAGAGLRRLVAAGSADSRHLPAADRAVVATAYLRALRPHQWVKNVLVFLPLAAAHQFSLPTLLSAVAAFVAFSLAASSVYILNDLLDLKADRAHPRKRQRPFASGAVPIVHGVWMALVLIAAALLLAMIALPPAFLLVLALYYLATMAYSFSLKRKMIVDICALAGLYTLRVIGGGAAAAVVLSPWLLAFALFLFLALAALKRQAELIGNAGTGSGKLAGRNYLVGDLPVMTTMALVAGYNAVLVLALYINSPNIAANYSNPVLLWGSCPILLYWIGRLVLLTHRGYMDDDPVVFAVRDPVSLACGVATLLCAAAASVT